MNENFERVKIDQALSTKYPEQIVAVSSVDNSGQPNAIILGWSMIASGNPPMMAIAIDRNNYSNQLIKECQEFVLAFPSPDVEEQVEFCGSKSGRDYQNKLKECGWETEAAEIVAPPLLKGCIANFECTVEKQVEAGDHTTFFGEIVAAHKNKENLERLYNFGDGVFAPAAKK